MSIMDMFKTKPADVISPNIASPTVAKTEVSTVEDSGQKNVNDPAKVSENPLDIYKKMFDNATKQSDIQAPSFAIDPAVLQDVSSKMDFTKGINPELVQKAMSGDAAAMMDVIRASGQNAYRASLEHATKLTDTHLGQRSEFESKRLKDGVRSQLTSDALSSNINHNHPVVKAELNRIAKSFANSPEYADASPQEIARAAEKYMGDLHAAMNPADPSKTKEGKAKPAEIDYFEYLQGN